MKKLAITIILLICLISLGYSQSSNLIGFYDSKSREPLIFASIISIDSLSKEVHTDLDGKVHLNKFGNEELLLVNFIGFKSLIISANKLSKNDSIFLEQLLSESEGLQPMSATEIYIPSDYSNCKSSTHNKVAPITRDLSAIREQKVEIFTSELQEVCERGDCNYVADFQVDNNGNLRNFELVCFDYIPRMIDQVEMLRVIAKYILQNPKCFESSIESGNGKWVQGTKEYKVSLKSK